MRQIASFLILVALFLLLIGSRFQQSDGDHLKLIAQMAIGKVRGAMPPAEKVAGPATALRNGLPQRLEDRIKSRLEADKRLAGMNFEVSTDGGTARLRGLVPDESARSRAIELAENTMGIDSVVDELAVPESGRRAEQ